MNYQIEQADMAMDGTDNQQASNIKQEYNLARIGLNMDQSVNQVQKGQLTYALNAQVDNFDGSSLNYQNEAGNVFCMNFPTGYKVIGESDNYEAAIIQIYRLEPDVAILNLEHNQTRAIDLSKNIRKRFPKMGIVFSSKAKDFRLLGLKKDDLPSKGWFFWKRSIAPALKDLVLEGRNHG